MTLRERFEKMKSTTFVGYIVYWKKIRKVLLRLIIIINAVLFLLALWNNIPSMVLYAFNMHFLYKYFLNEYPEERIKKKDRFKGIR